VRKRFGDGGDDAALDLLSAVTWNPDAPGRRAFFSLAQPFTAGMVSRRDMSPIHRASSPLELKHPRKPDESVLLLITQDTQT
jgi:hypothetical protein